MLILSILKSLVMIFIMILPGIFFRKFTPMTVENSDGVNSFLVNLAWPCLVIDAMQIPFSKMLRLTKTKMYLTIFMLMFGNTGFIGLPVIKALYGTEALFYAAIAELVNDTLLFTVGMACIQR